MNAQHDFWLDYYGSVARAGNPWLDYSNERVQAQTFGLALDAAGPVGGRCCIDIGCGWGQFSRTLSALGAAAVTGVDIVPEVIARHQEEHPHIRWVAGSLHDAGLVEKLGACDLAFLLEVLQYVPFATAVHAVWGAVRPGGRLVAVVPNAACPIVTRARERLGPTYTPAPLKDLQETLTTLPHLEHAAYRGLSFRGDQRVAPYDVSPWRQSGGWDAEPNRIQFVAIKADANSAVERSA